MPVLEACGLYPDIGLEVLREKALITISRDMFNNKERFDMHDLVQEMGHHLVKGEHPNDPEKHSRVWKEEDVETICAMDATTDLDMIEAVKYKYKPLISERDDPLQHLLPIFENMKNLRLIDWEGGLSSTLLTNFPCPLFTNSPQKKLCCVILRGSLQKQLWEGHKHLPNLKMMKLFGFKNLTTLPNFAGLPNIERFELIECHRLQEIHSSFGDLEKLVFLSIEKCNGIKIFLGINRLKNLKTLLINGSFILFKLIRQKMDNVALDPHLDNSLLKLIQQEQPSLPYINMKLPTLLWEMLYDHFIGVSLPHQIPKGELKEGGLTSVQVIQRLLQAKVKAIEHRSIDGVELNRDYHTRMHIIMKQKADKEDPRFENWRESDGKWEESDDAPEYEYRGEMRTHVLYVSFSSLRKTTSLKSSYNSISFSMENELFAFSTELVPTKSIYTAQITTEIPKYKDYKLTLNKSNNILRTAELVPMKRKDDAVQTTKVTTNRSEFLDGEDGYYASSMSFEIHQDSKSNIRISWSPSENQRKGRYSLARGLAPPTPCSLSAQTSQNLSQQINTQMASSSSSSPSIPAFSSRSWKHHVFLSFRGEDTRNNFVGHLYTALVNKGIITYKDDQKLSMGEAISPSLIEAIEQSQIAIIVFSENYADSSCCLNELRHIMKCRKERGLIVVPIFYGVEPSEVRKQKRKYGEAFSKYELENNTNVASWREALVEASGNSGQDFKSGSMDESQLIKNIVNKITEMKRPLTPRVNEKLVGVEARRDALISELQIESDCVRMIGIWGVGGGGKTTLATSVYSKISWEFDGCCCIENVRDESSKNGLVTLQKKIISGVLKQVELQVGSIEEGKDMIRDMLSGKKVLIVLDDVDQRDQLEALAGACDWFGKGSRIIITTRNEHLLKVHNVGVYKVTLLHNDEATTLLHKCAPLEERLMKDYEQVSQEVVTYASGLPLALTVLGSFLCGRGINEWKSTLARLKEIPDDDIVGKLRISYDGLKKVEQDLFLHIACFFRGVYRYYAMPVLEACALYPEIGLKVLREKALITISDDVKFDMHDLVQEMAHHIVRGEHRNDPEKHSRIWKKEDVETICAMGATKDLDMIEAISHCYGSVPYWRRWSHYFPPFALFTKRSKEEELELLFSKRANQLQHLPPAVVNMKNLKWVDWEGVCPLLTNSPLNKLCCLTLSMSLQKQLWDGQNLLPNLKMMKLFWFKNLIMLPNFAGLPNLERFELKNCPKLQEIHSSFGLLEKLVFVSVVYCCGIKIFPSINRLKNLKTVSFKWSTGLFKLIQHEQPSLPYSNMNHHTRLRFSQPNLTKLDLGECELTDEDICSYKWELSHLQELDLSFNKFSRLDFSGWRLPRLKWLCVDQCGSLVELSNLPSSIAVVEATHCLSLESFGDTSNCKWLWKVSTLGGKKVDPIHGKRLLKSMLQGNAIEDHFISLTLPHQIPKRFVGRFFRGSIFTMSRNPVTLKLPDDWHNDFSGFLLRVVGRHELMGIDIIMKQKAYKDDQRSENMWEPDGEWQECVKATEPQYAGEMRTHVIYASFSSLRKTTSLNSSYNIISFSINGDWSSFTLELVPMKSKDDGGQSIKVTTNCSEFRDEEDGYFMSSTNFPIHQDSKSNIKISWSCNTADIFKKLFTGE
ncbi:hypothetical protein LXL04_026835 [Taraxacum kok-saghyz]